MSRQRTAPPEQRSTSHSTDRTPLAGCAVSAFPDLGAALADDAGDVHLGETDPLPYPALRHVLEEAQVEDVAVALGEVAQPFAGGLTLGDEVKARVAVAERVGTT